MTTKDNIYCFLAVITLAAFVLCIDYLHKHPAQSVPDQPTLSVEDEIDWIAETAWNSAYQEHETN